MAVPAIQSEGDLEVVLLHEAHSALAALVGPALYTVGGDQPEQSCQFHNHPCFDLFLILLIEFFAEGTRCAQVTGKYQNWSLMRGLQWLCEKHPDETQSTGLGLALDNLDAWTKREVQVRFWCPDVNRHVEFALINEHLVWFGANTAKHHLLRLSQLLGKLGSLCEGAGYSFSAQELTAVLASMVEEVRSRLRYHATYILELLGAVFFALNALIRCRFDANPTNRVSDMKFPAGLTSDVFRDLYGSVLVFQRYDEQRIRVHTPVTTRFLRLRYQ